MVLILSHSLDFYNIDLFIDYLKRNNVDYYRLNTDKIGDSITISIDYSGQSAIYEDDRKILDGVDVTGVWHRKTWPIQLPEVDPRYKAFVEGQVKLLREAFYDSLIDIPWVNSRPCEAFVDRNKPFQLKTAQAAGLLVPPTLYTNQTSEILSFFKQQHAEKLICKMVSQPETSMSGAGLRSTMLISEELLEEVEALAICPMIYQPYIDKQYELRVAYVDGECFAGKINQKGSVDWRVSNDEKWEAYELPDYLCASITQMMGKLGLIQGAIDLIRDPDGKYYFLEVNPQGEWGMLQKNLGYPIAERLADALLKRIK